MASLANGRSQRRAGPLWTWLSFCAQVLLVVALGSADDLLHALTGQNNQNIALANAAQVVTFETAHRLWVEPALQIFFTHAHDLFGTVIGSVDVVAAFNLMYGLGHVGITLAFALWMYLYRRPLFAFVRNIFLITNALAVMIYEIFPLAPPRLANSLNLRYDGRPFHFLDPVFGAGKGLKLGFNEFAAMPSLHVGWSLIVALTLFMVLRPLALRLAVLLYPAVMLTTVIVTGNHYVADGLGAAAVLAIATAFALGIEWWHSEERTLRTVLRRLHDLRHAEQVAPRQWADAEQPHTPARSAA
jgi:hypothetical protein